MIFQRITNENPIELPSSAPKITSLAESSSDAGANLACERLAMARGDPVTEWLCG